MNGKDQNYPTDVGHVLRKRMEFAAVMGHYSRWIGKAGGFLDTATNQYRFGKVKEVVWGNHYYCSDIECSQLVELYFYVATTWPASHAAPVAECGCPACSQWRAPFMANAATLHCYFDGGIPMEGKLRPFPEDWLVNDAPSNKPQWEEVTPGLFDPERYKPPSLPGSEYFPVP